MNCRIVATTVALAWMMIVPTGWADTTVSLHEAVRQGKVKVDVKSRGGATGSTVRVEVQRAVPESLRIEVAPGTVLVNSVNTEQNVTVGQLKGEFTRGNMYRPGSVMVLADGAAHSFLLEVYCLDYAKKAPKMGGGLQLALQDKRVARILSPPAGVKPSLGAVQVAIWMDRAGITAEEARKRSRLPITDVDVKVARQLLAHAEKVGVESIPDDMPTSVRVHVTKLFASDPEVRRRAAKAIGELGIEARSAVSFLAENLLDRSTDKPLPASVVQVDVDAALGTAAQSLERLNIAELAPLIDSLREGSSASVAEDAVRTAQGIVGGMLREGLIGRLKSPLAVVRMRAAERLGRSGNQQAVEPLIELLEDTDQQVRKAAATALQTITGQTYGTDVDRWRQWLKDR